MLAALTGLGLSAAAGLNAYIPYLLVALLARRIRGTFATPPAPPLAVPLPQLHAAGFTGLRRGG